MKLLPIPLEQGIVLVDENAEIKEGELEMFNGKMRQYSGGRSDRGDGKILCQTPELSLPNIPYVELKVKDDVEKLALKECDKGLYRNTRDLLILRRGFIIGYNSNPNKFNEEDMIGFPNWLVGNRWYSQWEGLWIRKFSYKGAESKTTGELFQEYLQSLRKPNYSDIDCVEIEEGITYQESGKTFWKVKEIKYK